MFQAFTRTLRAATKPPPSSWDWALSRDGACFRDHTGRRRNLNVRYRHQLPNCEQVRARHPLNRTKPRAQRLRSWSPAYRRVLLRKRSLACPKRRSWFSQSQSWLALRFKPSHRQVVSRRREFPRLA